MTLRTIQAKTSLLVLIGSCLILGGIATTYAGLFAKVSRERTQLQQQVCILQEILSEKELEISTLSEQIITLVAVSFSKTEDTSSLLQFWIDRANRTIHVMVMLITQDELADALIDAYERGVEVRIIIDDDWLYASGSDYERILNAGVDIRGDDQAGLMHHKVMIVDGYIVVTGSYNWSWSAEKSNDENILILKSSVIAQAYLKEFYRIWEGTARATREEAVALRVVINEMEQNPLGTDAGYEWVELYNPTDQPLDIGGWTLSTTHGVTVTLRIPDGTIIDPGGYLVYSYEKQWLDNEDESVILRDTDGILIDETPLLNDPYNNGWAWSRHPNGYDTNSVSDWLFQPSTMGYENP